MAEPSMRVRGRIGRRWVEPRGMASRRALLAIPVLLALLPVQAGAAVAGPARAGMCSSKPTRIHAFHVTAEWTKRAYKRSEKATLTVTVTRPAHTDPLGEGMPLPIEPPTSVPVEGVTVWTSLATDAWPPPYAAGTTDASGQVTMKIALKDVDPGPVDVGHYASKWTNQSGCPDIEEWGYLYESPGITVLP